MGSSPKDYERELERACQLRRESQFKSKLLLCEQRGSILQGFSPHRSSTVSWGINTPAFPDCACVHFLLQKVDVMVPSGYTCVKLVAMEITGVKSDLERMRGRAQEGTELASPHQISMVPGTDLCFMAFVLFLRNDPFIY